MVPDSPLDPLNHPYTGSKPTTDSTADWSTITMAEIISLKYSSGSSAAPLTRIRGEHTNTFSAFPALISYLFTKGNNEADTNHATVIFLDTARVRRRSKLDLLPYSEKVLLLKYFFNHLNIILLDIKSATSESTVESLNECIDKIDHLISDRISRVETWTGTGYATANDFFISEEEIAFKISDIVATMSFVLTNNLNKLPVTTETIEKLNALIMEEIDFKSLLSQNSDAHLQKLCHLVGHWSFPSHELTNDDLVYCVYLILKYTLNYIQRDPECSKDKTLYFPNSNELLGLVFMVRDTYKNGNPFHNFRHAVDVLQACFHYVIRLNCLPKFQQLAEDPTANELDYLVGSKAFVQSTELLALSDQSELSDRKSSISATTTSRTTTTTSTTSLSRENNPVNVISAELSLSTNSLQTHLTAFQTLGLLVAALGHDVGHPGVTNAFMIKYSAPTAQVFNERSVLELFHSAVFINKILSINWPTLLNIQTVPGADLTLKKLITSCILATDMAEHFEYIDKLATFNLNCNESNSNTVKLISSLLIKCADISNVTRPLRVSSQWAMVLSREFEEVSILEKKLAKPDRNDRSVRTSVLYEKVPTTVDGVLEKVPLLHKGQIFFIDAFAEKLFKNIVELLPELKYTSDVILDNKEFWLQRQSALG